MVHAPLQPQAADHVILQVHRDIDRSPRDHPGRQGCGRVPGSGHDPHDRGVGTSPPARSRVLSHRGNARRSAGSLPRFGAWISLRQSSPPLTVTGHLEPALIVREMLLRSDAYSADQPQGRSRDNDPHEHRNKSDMRSWQQGHEIAVGPAPVGPDRENLDARSDDKTCCEVCTNTEVR